MLFYMMSIANILCVMHNLVILFIQKIKTNVFKVSESLTKSRYNGSKFCVRTILLIAIDSQLQCNLCPVCLLAYLLCNNK